MLYTNNAKVRKLIGVKRVKKWIKPGETVDLDSFDARTLGGNAAFFSLSTKKHKDIVEITSPDKNVEDIKKVAKKNESEIKKALKESLEGMTKARLVEVAEKIIGIDVKSKANKATILNQILKAAKEKGYAYVLKNS